MPPGVPPDYELLIGEVIKDKLKDKKNLRFSDMPDEGPPGEVSIFYAYVLY